MPSFLPRTVPSVLDFGLSPPFEAYRRCLVVSDVSPDSGNITEIVHKAFRGLRSWLSRPWLIRSTQIDDIEPTSPFAPASLQTSLSTSADRYQPVNTASILKIGVYTPVLLLVRSGQDQNTGVASTHAGIQRISGALAGTMTTGRNEMPVLSVLIIQSEEQPQ